MPPRASDSHTDQRKDGEMTVGAMRIAAPIAAALVVGSAGYTPQLYAVGRSGPTVTVVVLGQMGKAQEAPLDAVKCTVTAAMGSLGGA